MFLAGIQYLDARQNLRFLSPATAKSPKAGHSANGLVGGDDDLVKVLLVQDTSFASMGCSSPNGRGIHGEGCGGTIFIFGSLPKTFQDCCDG